MAPARPSRVVYRINSASQSNTSLSENDDDYLGKSVFSCEDNPPRAPAQWVSRGQHQPPRQHMTPLPPEIIIHILKHLHLPRDLYHALLISRAWCECAVELLWHRPTFTRLSTLVKLITVISRPDHTFTYARFIKRLNFLFLGIDLRDVLFSRFKLCDRLERLNLVNCSNISEDALCDVLTKFPNLIAIDLSAVVDTSDRVIHGLALVAKRLQGINLTGCNRVTDAGVLDLARECTNLRRVKLSGVEQVTDVSVSVLSKACPLLLEIDLHGCRRITNASVRDLWVHCTHMREMRLSHCSELTDTAFPASFHSRDHILHSASLRPWDDFPPLVLSRTLDHLRMLDITGCALITDDAVEGIISHAPKIRNLVLSKCSQLTDRAVESVCLLGKHLHYLHLGHAIHITDRAIKSLARCCTRLRYVDFANCSLLTDMSVFELASLPKLRRIGLVRVSNLTDEAIYALAERHSTLERIHLSYCDQISVMAIHFLLQKLHKLTHLSLTGIPSFRKPELQQFCRQPPPEFNSTQRSSFCVYSGTGVARLRSFLMDLFNTITEDMQGDDEETEYDDDFDESFVEVPHDVDVEMGHEADLDDDFMHDGRFHFQLQPWRSSARDLLAESMITPRYSNVATQHDPGVSSSSVPPFSEPSTTRAGVGFVPVHPQPAGEPPRSQRWFGIHPAIGEAHFPVSNEATAGGSAGTTQSTGTQNSHAFRDVASSSRGNGAMTPEYDYAETGRRRGTNGLLSPLPPIFGTHSFIPLTTPQHPAVVRQEHRPSLPLAMPANSVPWPHIEPPTPIASSSGNTNPPANAPPIFNVNLDPREPEGRARGVRRNLRNTLNAAEYYASTLLFGRPPNTSGPSSGQGSDAVGRRADVGHEGSAS